MQNALFDSGLDDQSAVTMVGRQNCSVELMMLAVCVLC